MKQSIILVVFLCCAFSIFGQNQDITNTSRERFFIGEITVQGAENYDRSAIKVIAGLHEGMVIHIPGDEISEAIQNLWNEKLFADVHIAIESREDDMVHLLIELVSLPKLSRFSFQGLSEREANKLREEIKLFSGKTITKDLVYITESKIKSYYKKKGFHATEVRIEQSDDPVMVNSKIFTIIINKKEACEDRRN